MVCNSHGDTKWYYQEYNTATKLFEVLLVSKEPVLKFNKVKYRDTGYYYCYGVYYNKDYHFIASRLLKVYGMLLYSVNYFPSFMYLFKMFANILGIIFHIAKMSYVVLSLVNNLHLSIALCIFFCFAIIK